MTRFHPLAKAPKEIKQPLHFRFPVDFYQPKAEMMMFSRNSDTFLRWPNGQQSPLIPIGTMNGSIAHTGNQSDSIVIRAEFRLLCRMTASGAIWSPELHRPRVSGTLLAVGDEIEFPIPTGEEINGCRIDWQRTDRAA